MIVFIILNHLLQKQRCSGYTYDWHSVVELPQARGKWYSSMKMKNAIFSWFTDIDECEAGFSKCKKVSYCVNEIGSYYCSCVPHLYFLNWVAGFIKLNHPACYGKNPQVHHGKGGEGAGIWDFHPFQARVTEQTSFLALVLHPSLFWRSFPRTCHSSPGINHHLYAAVF